ncbi:MAG TPA: sulfur carrier protein ThiS [Thermoanaerobaculia bacterium]|nr:sulfur carrier protein ThiS [Thermoanaerobaculia bacterium]
MPENRLDSRTAAEALDLTLNGEPYRIAAGSTVLDLLAALGRDPRTVAVERNGEIVRRAQYGEAVLAAGDRLEVVHFVQGG